MICNYYNSGSWASHVKDQHQWIQVEFKRHFKIGAIQTQGRSDAGQWVKTYKLSYGNDGINWRGVYDNDGKERVKLLFKYTLILLLHDRKLDTFNVHIYFKYRFSRRIAIKILLLQTTLAFNYQRQSF